MTFNYWHLKKNGNKDNVNSIKTSNDIKFKINTIQT